MSEKVDVYMPWFVSDYLTDTADLSLEEHGAYSMLLMHMWARGGWLPLDHARLARLCRVDLETWAPIWSVIEHYFTETDDGQLTQKRLHAELEKAQKRKADAKTNGRKGGLRAGKEPEASDPTSDPGSDPTSETVATLPATLVANGQRPPQQNGSEKVPLQSPISNLQSPSGTPPPSPSPQTEILVGLTPDGMAPAPEVSGELQKVREVFGHYRTFHPKAFPNPKADSKEAGLIRARLREGYSVEALKQAIDGYHLSPFHCGENDSGQTYLGLELFMRTGTKVAAGIDFASQRAPPVRTEAEVTNVRAGKSWVQRKQGGDHERR